MTAEARESFISRHFVLVVSSGFCYFTALAMTTPVLPDYVDKSLAGGSISIGIAVGAISVGSVALRWLAGLIGDTVGRRILIVGGALIVALSTGCYGLVHALWFLVLLRIVTGFGEAGFFVGAATMITDLAPVDRRGEAVSYWSVAVYGGFSVGPVLGSVLHGDANYGVVWIVSAGLALVAAVIGWFTVEVPRSAPMQRPEHLFNRGAIDPGIVLFLGLIPLAGFMAFVPGHADNLNVSPGLVLALYGVLILGVRIFGARLPDRLGGRTTATIALLTVAAGFGVIAAVQTVAGLLLGTVVFASGMSLLYPALLVLALDGVSEAERGSVVGTISTFFDASQGLGARVSGAVVHFTGDAGAITTGAICALIGFAVLRGRSATRATAPA
jgi:MFS family permease